MNFDRFVYLNQTVMVIEPANKCPESRVPDWKKYPEINTVRPLCKVVKHNTTTGVHFMWVDWSDSDYWLHLSWTFEQLYKTFSVTLPAGFVSVAAKIRLDLLLNEIYGTKLDLVYWVEIIFQVFATVERVDETSEPVPNIPVDLFNPVREFKSVAWIETKIPFACSFFKLGKDWLELWSE